MNDIYKMKLHETIPGSCDNILIMRVSGGWIYTIKIPDAKCFTSTFVRFDNEFMDVPK